MKEDTSASTSKEEERGEESSIEILVQYKSYLKSLKNSTNPHRVKYDILAHLRRIPALLSVYDALQLSEELRRALILALLSLDVFKTEIDHIEGQPLSSRICASCLACITFSDEDLQLGKKFHNRPLYVKGTIRDA